jgi:hypothetical protein
MAEIEWKPERYLREIRIEIPRYDEFQDARAQATRGVDAYGAAHSHFRTNLRATSRSNQ